MADPEKDGDDALRRVVSNYSTKDEDDSDQAQDAKGTPTDSTELLMDLDKGVVGWDSKEDPYNPM